jgi:pimeloyl-ACP methyl ester carboxylesterase
MLGRCRNATGVDTMRRLPAVLPAPLVLAVALACAAPALARPAALPPEDGQPAKTLPLPGEVFSVEGRAAFVLLPGPEGQVAGRPWVWYAPTLPGLPGPEEAWMFRRFLDAGVAVAGIDVGESYGSPDGRALYSSLYRELVEKRGFAKKPCLLARSRGGLMLTNWAVEHPESVGGIAGIYPVCDLRSYPGLAGAAPAYRMTPEQLTEALARHNPIDRVEPLARAGVPVLHLHGDRDTVVPLEANSAELARRYRRSGGAMTLVVIEGRGHDMWPGWFQSEGLVAFAIARAKAGAGR